MRRIRDFQLRIQALRKRVRRSERKFDGNTQAIRGILLADLQEVFNFAQKRMKAVRKEKYKQFWARLVAYIAQTIAYVAKEYDLSRIQKKVIELEQKFLRLKEKTFKKQSYVS